MDAGFVTPYSQNKIYKNNIMGLQEYFAATVFNMCLFIVTDNNFPKSNPNL